MQWFRHACDAEEAHRERRRFARLFAILGRPRGMLMVSTPWDPEPALYIGVASQDLIAQFPGFHRIAEPPPIGRGEVGHDCDLAGFRPPLSGKAA